MKNSFNSYPISTLNQAAAIASIADDDYFRLCCQKIIDNRESLAEALDELGFEVLPSSANFVFTQHPTIRAEALYQQLRDRGILVRYFNKERIDNHLRISIGDETECQALVTALQSIIRGD